MSPAEIITGVERRDPAAEQSLFDKYFWSGVRRLRQYFQFRPEADTESICQDAIIKLFQAVRNGAVREPEKLNGYFATILMNEARSYFRHLHGVVLQFTQLADSYEIEFADNTDLEAELLQREKNAQLEMAILTANISIQSASMIRQILWGTGQAEIARESGVNPITVRIRALRATEKIKRELRRQELYANSHTQAQIEPAETKSRAATTG